MVTSLTDFKFIGALVEPSKSDRLYMTELSVSRERLTCIGTDAL